MTERRKELEHKLESMKSWETTQRLQKVLDEKKKKQAREAEKLRQEVGGNVVCFSTKLKMGIVPVLTASIDSLFTWCIDISMPDYFTEG